MLEFVKGRIARKGPAQVTLEVGGWGLGLRVPLSTSAVLPAPGAEVVLRTSLLLSADGRSQRLNAYGFASADEHELFELLLTVSGVGPSTALAVLSGMSPAEFAAAVRAGDATRLRRVRGVGKRIAERLLVELRDRLERLELGAAACPAPAYADTVQALLNFGFNRPAAEQAAQRALADLGANAAIETVVRRALQLAE